MKMWNLLKEIWSTCSKKEIAGWIFFAGGFTLLLSTQTIFWDITKDKLEGAYLIYRFIMAVFFTTLSGMGLFLGYRAVNIGWHLAEEDEFWRAFTGGAMFAVLLIGTVFIESFVPSLRASQMFENIQGFFYIGTVTGCGMVWYLFAIGYVRKKNRAEATATGEDDGEKQETEEGKASE